MFCFLVPAILAVRCRVKRFDHLAPEGWHAISPGSNPIGKLNGGALALPQEKDISGQILERFTGRA